MSRVTAILTVYYPSYENRNNIEKICKQVDRTIICDNSLQNNIDLFQDLTKTTYHFWGQNLGLSAAFNKVLTDSSYEWEDDEFVIFFDQDTVICDMHIEKLIAEYNLLEKEQLNIGCLGPLYYDSNSQIEIPRSKKYLNTRTMSVKSVITTSFLCKYVVLKKVKFWNEEIFLDMADWDLCWRLKAENLLCCMTSASIISHRVGTGKKNYGLIKLWVWKPFREYYQIRDCLYLMKKRYVPLKFRINFIMMLTIRPILHLLFLDNKQERLQYMRKGVKDYYAGIKGELR